MGIAILALATLSLSQAGQSNEPELREAFAREFKDKLPDKRIEALRKLSSQHQEKTLLALAEALKDPVAEVRKTAAEVIGSCTDVAGAGIKGLCASLLNKKEDKDVRAACARSLKNVKYKAEAINTLVQVISAIGEQEKELFQLGVVCTESVNWLASQDFGAGKETPDKWKKWWAENKARITKDDQEQLASYRKSAAPKGK